MITLVSEVDELLQPIQFRQKQLCNDFARLLTRSNWDSEFYLVYQPQIDVLTGEIFGFEALLRWRSPHQGLVMPSEFIPIAERLGFIGPLNGWVLCQIAQEMMSGKMIGATFPSPCISVNITPRQLLETNLLMQMQVLIERQWFKPSNIMLELTDTDLLVENDVAIASLRALRDRGFANSLTLTSQDHCQITQAMVLIETLPIDMLKFDRGFMARLHHDLEAEAAFFSIVKLAKCLQIHLAVEGVENLEQIEFLSWHGCRVLQGNWYSSPMSVENLQNWLVKFPWRLVNA